MKRVDRLILIGLIVPNFLWAERFLKKEKVIYDSQTKLYWQMNPSIKNFTWDKAIKYCRDLTYSDKSNWRLPNIDELKSLIDYKKYKPAIATNLIKIKTDNWYWSSSVYFKDSSQIWVVDFNRGSDNWYSQSKYHYVLCVQRD